MESIIRPESGKTYQAFYGVMQKGAKLQEKHDIQYCNQQQSSGKDTGGNDMRKIKVALAVLTLMVVVTSSAVALDSSGTITYPFTGGMIFVHSDGSVSQQTQTIGTLHVYYSLGSNSYGYTGASLTGQSLIPGSLTTGAYITQYSAPSFVITNNNQTITVTITNWQVSITYRYKYIVDSNGNQTLSSDTMTSIQTATRSNVHR